MLESVFADVIEVLEGTFLNGDWVGLAIAAGAILFSTITMRRGTQVASMTLLALALFAVGGYFRDLFGGVSKLANAFNGRRLAAQLEDSWAIFMDMTAASLLSYFLAFMVLIVVLFGAKTLFTRG